MVKLARGRGIDVLLIATPEPALLPSAPAFYADNARGYRLIAERIAERLQRAGAI